jgi:hypothetical protein
MADSDSDSEDQTETAYDTYKAGLDTNQQAAVNSLSVDYQELFEAAFYVNKMIGYIAADKFQGAWTITNKEPGVQQLHVSNNGVVSHSSNLAVGAAAGTRDNACNALVKCAAQIIRALESATNQYQLTDTTNAEDIDKIFGAPDVGAPVALF